MLYSSIRGAPKYLTVVVNHREETPFVIQVINSSIIPCFWIQSHGIRVIWHMFGRYNVPYEIFEYEHLSITYMVSFLLRLEDFIYNYESNNPEDYLLCVHGFRLFRQDSLYVFKEAMYEAEFIIEVSNDEFQALIKKYNNAHVEFMINYIREEIIDLGLDYKFLHHRKE